MRTEFRHEITRVGLLKLAVLIAIGYVFLVPVSNNALLYPLILALGAAAFVCSWRARRRPDRLLVPPLVTWAVFLGVGVTTAIVRGAESWPRVLVFLAFWPAVYAVMVIGFPRWLLRPFFAVGAGVTICIGAVVVLQGLTATGVAPLALVPSGVVDLLALRTSVSGNAVAMSTHALPPLIWWGAMWVASLGVDRANHYLPPLWVRWAAAVLAIAGALIAWRRAIVLVLVAVPVLAIITWLLLRRRGSRPSGRAGVRAVALVAAAFVVGGVLAVPVQRALPDRVAALGASLATVVMGSDSPLTNEDLMGSRTISQDDALADRIRANEIRVLTSSRGLADLLVGRGLGAWVDRGEFQRAMKPWQTELQYHLLFYWSGLIGLLLIAVTGLLCVRAVLVASTRDRALRPALYVSSVGALATLAANATNPYLQAPGHMWPIFLPLMIASLSLRGTPPGPSARNDTGSAACAAPEANRHRGATPRSGREADEPAAQSLS